MINIRKTGLSFLFTVLMIIAWIGFSEKTALASEVILPTEYYFVFNGQQRKAGTEYEMKTPEVLLNVTSGVWEPETTVEWVSSEPGVVSLESTSYGSNFTKLVRKGPGYATITAVIKQGTNSYSMSCLIKVGLEFDYQKTGMTAATTANDRILVMDTVGQEKQVYLKYTNYTPDGEVVAVSGSAISASAVLWESENEGVATIDSKGKVVAVGSGSTTITVTSNTMSSQDRPMLITMKVVVKPEFSITFDNRSGVTRTHVSVTNKTNPAGVVDEVPSNFVIESKATLGANLKWEVFDFSTKKKLAQTSNKLSYSISEISGNVTFSNVKAGTYEIYAFADKSYSLNTNAPYAYMKIIVPIDIREQNIIMTVGDTYNIIENSNITGVGVFGSPVYTLGNPNIARFDATNYVITAKRKGKVTIELTYNTALDLFDEDYEVGTVIINVTVIDGIALSTTNATMFTKGTLLLDALVTDPTEPIVWSSSVTSVATVVDGLVTGVNPGTTIITAKQTINGIVKSATCEITVQQSVATIKINPATVTLPIKGYATLHATITPANLQGVTLQWKSSNEAVVKVVESGGKTATIQGIGGGNAVISAINQDNVVVGYSHISVQQPVTSIALSETSGIVNLNTKRLQIRATVYPENALNKTIEWTTTDPTKATVDANGLVTFLKPGTVTIIAVSQDNPKVKAMCNLTIQIPVVSVSLDETTKTMYVGQTERLSYVVLPTNADNNAVTWTSTNTSVATVDATGRVSAKSTGTAVIILKSLDGGYSVYCTITVRSVATGVKFDVSKLDMKTGETYTIKTTLTPKNSTDTNLVWESSDTQIVMVDDQGKLTAKGVGKAIIMARTEAGGIAYCTVTVTQPVQGILLNFTEKTVYVGTTFKLKATVKPSNANNIGVTWKSSNPKVAQINQEGEISGITGGVTIITATSVEGGFMETCVVTVREPVTTVTLDYETYTLGIKKSFKLTATVTSDTATNQEVYWTSSDESVATVSQKGKVTGVSMGYATITATAKDGSEVEASCEVRIVTPVTGVTINKSYITLMVGETESLKATIKPNNSTFKTAKWTSSDESVAIVDEDGIVTAVKAGSVSITAEAQDSSGKYAVCYVVVYDRVPATSITVQDKKLIMVPGEEKIVNLVLNPVSTTDSYSWSTDNAAVANVDKKTGRIKAKSTGIAYVTVMTESGKTATVEVTVIGLNESELILEEYTTYRNVLQVEGASGSLSFRSENPLIAVVDNRGTVSTRGVGTTKIVVTYNGRKLTCKVTVNKMP